MDHVVDNQTKLKTLSNVEAINSKSCNNTSLNKASPRKIKSRTSSNESEYEVVAEFDEEDAEIGASCSEYEEDSDKNNKNDVKESVKTESNQMQNPSESAEMEEVFVVVEEDAANEVDSNVETPNAPSDKKQSLSEGDDIEMEEAPTKCEEKAEKKIPQLPDGEDDIDSLLDEFAETQSDELQEEKKSNANIIVLSEGEEEMDCLLKEFSEENCFDEDSPTKQNLLQDSDSSVPNLSIKNEERTIMSDIKNENSSDVSSSNLQPTDNCIIQPNNVQQSSDIQILKSSANETDVKVSSDCVILSDNDEKSNCSSIEILDDDSENETNPKTSLDIKGSTSNKELTTETKNKYNFKDMIVDIVDDDTNDDVSHSGKTKKVINSLNIPETQANSVVESCDKLNLSNSTGVSDTLSNSKDELMDKTDFECSSVKISTINQTETSSSEIKFPVHSNEISKTNEGQNKSSKLFSEDEDSSPIVIDDGDYNSSKISFKESTLVSKDDSKKKNEKQTLDDDLDRSFKSETKEEDVLKDVSEKEKKIISIADSDSMAEESVTLDIMKLVSEVAAKLPSDETDEDKILTLESDLFETKNILKSDEKLISESKSQEREDKLKSDSDEISINTETKIEEKCHNSGDSFAEDAKQEKNSLDLPDASIVDKSCEEDCKKRKLEDVTVDSDAKKIKTDDGNQESDCINGDVSSASSTSDDFGLKDSEIQELISDVTVADIKAVDKVSDMMPWNPSEKIETSKVVLDKIAMYVSQEVVKESYKTKYMEYKNEARALEAKIEKLSKNLDSFRLQFAEFRDTQKVAFMEQNFKGKLHTRTVGVNVKIYRETEIKQVLSMPNSALSKPAETSYIKQERHSPKKEPVPTVTSSVKAVKPGLTQVVLPSPQLKDTVITPVFTQQRNVRQQLIPRIISHPNRPITGAQVVTGLQQRIPSPNVTVTGNRLIPFTTRTPSTQVVLVPSSSISSTARNTLVNMSKEDLASKALNSNSISSAKVNVPGMPATNPNVLVPLREYLQLLPQGAKGSPVLQSAPAPRPAIIPQLPSSLLGARTVTYLVPQNAGLGARGIPQFLSPSNQPVQFLLRVTNPGSTPTFSPVVTSVPRQATAPLVSTNSAPRSSSGLVLFSHTSKHPAPFPKSPHYPDNKGKAIPPKPSLKGSKNSLGGIVLSWNMCMFRHHANISSYQLYAYQETDGPVDSSLWKKVGDVNALPLPMACTLTQFVDKNRYYFTVRAVDVFQRYGPFSDPVSVFYDKDGGDSTTKK